MLYLLSSLALAGTFTDAPGVLQGDFSIQNDFLKTTDNLYQTYSQVETNVGSRSQTNDNLNIHLLLGVMDFMSIGATLPIGFDTVSFSGISQAQFDPLTEIGTYVDTPTGEDYSIKGSGLEGIQLAIHFYPFHSKIFHDRGDQGNWDVGFVYRTPDNTNFFTTNANGKRGAGVGAQGFGLHSSFSKRNQFLEPYLQMKAIKSAKWSGSIRDDNGNTLVKSADFAPANTVDVRGGMEFFVWDDHALASYATIDLFGEYHYQSFQQIPSGIYLPYVLDTTKDDLITQTELISFQGGVGTNWLINSIYGFRLSGKVGYTSPQWIEHLYEVSTIGSFQWGIFTEFKLRYRTTAS